MTYSTDLPAAARRHLQAADVLAEGPRLAVAGYLYGISAECAIKAMMSDAGLRPQRDQPDSKRDDPFYAHFPRLRTLLRDSMSGRHMKTLNQFIGNDRFMSNWSTDMRYSHGRDIKLSWITDWKDQAHQAAASIGT